MKSIRIPSSKGNLAATVHNPQGESSKLAILCAGFLDSKDYAGLVGLANELAARGYTAVRFDATGVWESEGDIADYTTTQYLVDIEHVLEHMLGKGSYTEVLLGGHSRGGMVALLYAARDARVTQVFGIMPSSGRSMTPEREKKWRDDGVSVNVRDMPNDRDQKREFRVPFSHVSDRAQYDLVHSVAQLKMPVAFFAGEKDALIPPEDVQVLFDAAHEPKVFSVIPGVGHDYRLSDDEVQLVDEYVLRDLGVY